MTQAQSAVALTYRRVWLLLGLIWIGIVCYTSLASIKDVPMLSTPHFDKLVHFMVYAGLMGWFAQLYWSMRSRLVLVCGFILMGVGVEFLQGLTPERRFEYADMLANTAGVLVAWRLARGRLQQLLHLLETRYCNYHE